MSAPITPNPSIHNLPPAVIRAEIVAQDKQILALGEQFLQALVNALLKLITNTLGAEITASKDAIQYFKNLFANLFKILGIFDPANLLAKIKTDLFDVEQHLKNWIEDLIKPLKLLLGPDSPLNIKNLVGTLKADLLSFLHVGGIGNLAQELLHNPLFQGIESLIPGGHVIFDALTGLNSLGSAKFTANGTTSSVVSNPINVSEGQTLSASGKAKWAGLVFTGAPIELQIATYFDGAVVDYVVVDSITPGSPNGGWQTMSGTYPVPAGVDRARVKLTVTSDATAGTVWFESGSLQQTGLASGHWIKGIENTIHDDVQKMVDVVHNTVNGSGTTGHPLSTLETNFQNVWDKLFGHGNAPASAAALSAGIIPDIRLTMSTDMQGIVDRLMNAVGVTGSGHPLADIVSNVQNAFSARTLQNDFQGLIDGISNGLGYSGSFHPFQNIVTYVSNLNGNVAAKTWQTDFQTMIDGVANGLGFGGSFHPVSSIQSFIASLNSAVGARALQSDLQNFMSEARGRLYALEQNWSLAALKVDLQNLQDAIYNGVFGGHVVGTVISDIRAAIAHLTGH